MRKSGNSFLAFILGVLLTLLVVYLTSPDVFAGKDDKKVENTESVKTKNDGKVTEKCESVSEINAKAAKAPKARPNIKNVKWLDKPGSRINVSKFRITRVLDNGFAIARAEDLNDSFGLEVMFVPMDGVEYYDDMIIRIKGSQKYVMVGKYKKGRDTLPVVDIVEK